MANTHEIGAFGYVAAAIAYLLLAIVFLVNRQRSDQWKLLVLASGTSMLWAGAWTVGYLQNTGLGVASIVLEWARGLAWLTLSFSILPESLQESIGRKLRSVFGLLVLLLIGAPVAYFLSHTNSPLPMVVWVGGGFAFSVLAILIAEQLFRGSPADSISGTNYICIAIVLMFAFDLVIYIQIIAGIELETKFWAARGYVNALLVVPLMLGIWRRFRIDSPKQLPRQIVFYSFGAALIALYVALVIVGNYYIKLYAGTWSEVAGVVFLVAAILGAAVVLASSRTRARMRVFLMKSFLQYKYDYRNEWLRLISTLSKSGLEDVVTTAVMAVAQIVSSPGGVVWIQEKETAAYLPVGAWQSTVSNVSPIAEDSGLIKFLKNREWVIDLEEMKQFPERYENLQIRSWLGNGSVWWLIVPLFLGKRLYGFIVLLKPRVVPSLNFEDHDLLRTVGSQVGMHINQAEIDRRLTENRQFGAYNRLTAFLMHDLNNVIAQQSLVVKNAERFRNNPKFIDDAIETIAHSVSRMKRLMEQLNSRSNSSESSPTDVRVVLATAVDRCRLMKPLPKLKMAEAALMILADQDRLTTVFEHLIRNAQDATGDDGEIKIEASRVEKKIIVEIRDSGEGMSPEFIRERLFRPFDSTKGSQSMGIGAYQAKDYLRALGGHIEVSSVVGGGTIFSIRMPAC